MHLTGSIVLFKNQLLELQKAQTSFLQTEIHKTLYLIDNSPAYSPFFRDQNSQDIVHVHNESNLGFGAGHNIALNLAIKNQNSTYHLVFNPDTYFTPEVLLELISFMEKNPDVGLVSPKIIYPDGSLQPLCKLLPTPLDLIGRRFFPFLPFCKRQNAVYEMRFTGYNKIMDIPFISGSFMLIRSKVVYEVGMFDERFFLYMEDADLCRRIGQKYRTVYYPKVSVTHTYKKGSYKEFDLLYQHIRSAVLYFNKWGWIRDKERHRINQKILTRS